MYMTDTAAIYSKREKKAQSSPILFPWDSGFEFYACARHIALHEPKLWQRAARIAAKTARLSRVHARSALASSYAVFLALRYKYAS